MPEIYLIRLLEQLGRTAGWKIAAGVGAVLLGIYGGWKLLQFFLEERRRRIEASLQRQAAERAAAQQERREFLERLDRKDAALEKLTGNHIAHLEVQLQAAREFFESQAKVNDQLVAELKELRAEGLRHHAAMHNRFDKAEGQVDDVAGDIKEIKGKLS
jgi:hypothetical protein